MRITRYPTQSLDRTFLNNSLVQVALVIAVIVALLAVTLPVRIASAAQSSASASQMEVVIVPPRITIALGDDGSLQSITTSVFIGGYGYAGEYLSERPSRAGRVRYSCAGAWP